ncbi:MAG: NifB/NifX family molybdenum-iron cluster-binding protein [Halanaeroarchaeum sp.]
MRVGIPTEDDSGRGATLVEHFGHAPVYTVVDVETDDVEPIANESKHRGGRKLPPQFLADHDVDAVVAGHIGRRGITLFEELGIEVYRAEGETVADVLERWAANDLDRLRPEDGHSHGGGGHDHGGHIHSHGHDHDDQDKSAEPPF